MSTNVNTCVTSSSASGVIWPSPLLSARSIISRSSSGPSCHRAMGPFPVASQWLPSGFPVALPPQSWFHPIPWKLSWDSSGWSSCKKMTEKMTVTPGKRKVRLQWLHPAPAHCFKPYELPKKWLIPPKRQFKRRTSWKMWDFGVPRIRQKQIICWNMSHLPRQSLFCRHQTG